LLAEDYEEKFGRIKQIRISKARENKAKRLQAQENAKKLSVRRSKGSRTKQNPKK